jgi:hypothetical protein
MSLRERLAKLERKIGDPTPSSWTPILEACTDDELDALKSAVLAGDQAEGRRIVEAVADREGLSCP